MSEVVVVMAVLAVLALAILSALPRQRENARMAGCRRNLMQVGIGLVLYDRSEGRLPTVPVLQADPPAYGGPLKAILDALVLPDLTELADPSQPPPARPGQVPGGGRVPGFLCQSDPTAVSPVGFPSPVSYRATAGDAPQGLNGGFAPGRSLRLADIEQGDGQAYTAAFSERRLGRGKVHDRGIVFYAVVPGPFVGSGCPTPPEDAWRGDAGSSWAEASWRSTLYNHARPPNDSPSCVTEDGSAAFLGASSVHAGGVNVLIFDGSVRTVSPTVAPPVWKALATTHGGAASGPAVGPEGAPAR